MSDQPLTRLPPPAELAAYLNSFNFFEKYAGNSWEGKLYVETHTRRFLHTLHLLPTFSRGARILELGGVPYYMTILLKRFFDYKIETLSFYETEQAPVARHTIESERYNEQYEFVYRAVDVERDEFPFAEDSFDFVLCCELLEHLLINPSNMLYEIARVLRPRGCLLVTTPNVLRWGNVSALVAGRNIYDGYRGNGVHGRHSREYTPDEVRLLLASNGYAVEWVETANVYGAAWMNRVPRLFDGRRDNIFALARRPHIPRMSFPTELFLLMEQYRHAARSQIMMGANEVGQIGAGWYEFEDSTPGFRWTQASAEFLLKMTQQPASTLYLEARCHHPDAARCPVALMLRVNGEEAGRYEFTDHEWRSVSFAVSSDALVLRCELQVSRTWTPREATDAADDRTLGVAVSRIWLQ